MEKIEIHYTCDRCADEQIIFEGEELVNMTNEECLFCRGGTYQNGIIMQGTKQIGEIKINE